MKVKIEGEYDVMKISCVCLVCGKNMGSVVFLPSISSWDHMDISPLCNKCFKEKGLEVTPNIAYR